MSRELRKMSIKYFNFSIGLFKIALWFLIVYFIGMSLFKFGTRLFYERSLSDIKTKSVEFTINQNDNADIIADKLYDLGLIDDKLAFKFRSIIYKTNFTPNTYMIDKSMTIKNMLDIFDNKKPEYVADKSNTENDVYQLSPEEQDNIDEVINNE